MQTMPQCNSVRPRALYRRALLNCAYEGGNLRQKGKPQTNNTFKKKKKKKVLLNLEYIEPSHGQINPFHSYQLNKKKISN